MGGVTKRLPLQGVKILDLSRILSGPFATMRLADLGAEVIKVEMPGTGDDARGWGPPFAEGVATYFLSVNRGKQSLTLDLKQEEGKAILEKLIARSDVLFENFRTGTLERLGFGWERLREAYPRLIYATVSGYGTTGRRAGEPAFDLVVQGETGLMDLTGDPHGGPQKCGTSIADILAGLHAVEGILAALYQRQETGRGARVDISLLDGLLSTLTYQAAKVFHEGRSPKRIGNQHPSIAPYETYVSSDGYFNLCVGNEGHWCRFKRLLGDPALEDPVFATNGDRVTHRAAMNAILERHFAQRGTAEWLTLFREADIPAGPIRTLEEALHDPLCLDRQMVVPSGPIKALGNPVQVDGPCNSSVPPPGLGEHTREVLTDLGYAPQEIDRLLEARIV